MGWWGFVDWGGTFRIAEFYSCWHSKLLQWGGGVVRGVGWDGGEGGGELVANRDSGCNVVVDEVPSSPPLNTPFRFAGPRMQPPPSVSLSSLSHPGV